MFHFVVVYFVPVGHCFVSDSDFGVYLDFELGYLRLAAAAKAGRALDLELGLALVAVLEFEIDVVGVVVFDGGGGDGNVVVCDPYRSVAVVTKTMLEAVRTDGVGRILVFVAEAGN